MNSRLDSWNWFTETLRGVHTVDPMLETRATVEEVSEMSDQDLQSDLVEYRVISHFYQDLRNFMTSRKSRLASRYGQQCVDELLLGLDAAWSDSCLSEFGNALIHQPDSRFVDNNYVPRPCDSGE